MKELSEAAWRCRLWVAKAIGLARARDERGDVPGWVLVTVMTAGLVMLIWGLAGPQLSSILTSALNSVR